MVRAGTKNNKLKFLWPKMARLRPPFRPKNPPEKVYVGPFLRPFPGNEAHKLFSKGPKWGVLGGGQKVMLKKFMCFFGPLNGDDPVPYPDLVSFFFEAHPPPPTKGLAEPKSTMCKWMRLFWGTDCRRSPKSVSSAQAAPLCSAGIERARKCLQG